MYTKFITGALLLAASQSALSFSETRTSMFFENQASVYAETRNVDMTGDGQWMVGSGTFGSVGNRNQGIALTDLVNQQSQMLPALTLSDGTTPSIAHDPVAISENGKYIAVMVAHTPLFTVHVFNTVTQQWTSIFEDTSGAEITTCANSLSLSSLANNIKMHFAGDDILVFHAGCSGLVANDNNASSDVFLYDLVADSFELISQDFATGTIGDDDSFGPEISKDARFVLYKSKASNLDGNSCATARLMLTDRLINKTQAVTACGERVENYTISGDGSTVHYITDTPVHDSAVATYDVSSEQTTVVSEDTFGRTGINAVLETNYDGSKVMYSIDGAYVGNVFTRSGQTVNVIFDDRTSGERFTLTTDPNTGLHGNWVIQGQATMSDDGLRVSHGSSGSSGDVLLDKTTGEEASIVYTISDLYAASYDNVLVRGSFDSWSAVGLPMSLVNDNTWKVRATLAANDEFKFDIFGDWSENYGANGVADGANIPVTQGAGDYDIVFDDITKQSTITKVPPPPVGISFTCQNGTTYLGQSVYVIGNIDALGGWDIAQAVKLDPTSYPTWTGTLALPANTAVEWKCLKREEDDPTQGIEWQNGANNSFNTGAASSVSASF